MCPDTHTNQHKSIAAAFSHLRGPEWRQIAHITVTAHSQAERVLAQLAQSDWPCLEQLKLTNTPLSLATIKQLAAGSWPRLRSLDFTNDKLDVEAMTALIQGHWPMLTRLVLDSNATSSAVPAALIPNSASWASLSNLSLKRMKLNASCLHSILLLHNQLERLNLAVIGAAALAQLVSSPWPQLQHLTLESNRLGADAIASLALADMPNLKSLDLKHNKLDAAAASCLVKGRWLKLSCVTLDSNVAMAFLAKGHRPLLHTLSLAGSDLSVLGHELLMAGQWPQLSKLTLDGTGLSAATWTLLNLTGGTLPDHISRPRFVASRDFTGVSSNNRAVWPKLAQVKFMSCRPKACKAQVKAFKADVQAFKAEVMSGKPKSASRRPTWRYLVNLFILVHLCFSALGGKQIQVYCTLAQMSEDFFELHKMQYLGADTS